MKKLARLTALLLTGALLLVLTACGAETEQQAKQRLLNEINSYRASLDSSLDPLVEVKQLSDAEQDLINHFRAAGKTALPKSEADEALDDWGSKTKGWTSDMDFGYNWVREDNKWIYILDAMVPANTPEGKAELWAALKGSGKFMDEDCKHIGIAVVTIDGQMYWSCAVYYCSPLPRIEQHPLNQTKPDSLRAVRLLVLLGLQALTYSCT